VKLPDHIAIIMDGNGRWAKSRGRPRNYGHLKGARIARSTIIDSAKLGLKYLTLYAFSTENWLRPTEEVSFLMLLLERNIRKERKTLLENNIVFKCIGNLAGLPSGVAREVQKTVEATATNTGMILTFAINYGGRREIADSVKEIASRIAEGDLKIEDIDEELISENLQSQYMPDPDLIIRTSGEYRLSNFLLWQAAYSEIYITPICWPEFDRSELLKAIEVYSHRERRFGQVEPALSADLSPK
jgi:undecaprenyl diphosphate synthase